MIDRTSDFLTLLKSCQKSDAAHRKSSILSSRTFKPKTSFGKHTKEIVSNISKLRDFLLENRKSYIGGEVDQNMSDRDRDKLDADSESCMKTCSESLATLKQKEISAWNSTAQVDQHKKSTIEMIEKYLKAVCQVYSEQRAIRVKKVVDKKRISRLQSNVLKKRAPSEKEEADKVKPINRSYNFLDDSSADELSPEDEATFQQENTLLLNDMNSMIDEVKAIEGKVVEIARLQELFSEQVFQQEGDIELVSEKIVESSENVKDGNEELREAIKNNAGFRVWILFFLVMCSFSLLFLEWYS